MRLFSEIKYYHNGRENITENRRHLRCHQTSISDINILTLNNFIFNEIRYLQKLGCFMGIISGLNYANTFTEKFETKTSNIYVFKHFQIFIVDLSISFYSGMGATHNY